MARPARTASRRPDEPNTIRAFQLISVRECENGADGSYNEETLQLRALPSAGGDEACKVLAVVAEEIVVWCGCCGAYSREGAGVIQNLRHDFPFARILRRFSSQLRWRLVHYDRVSAVVPIETKPVADVENPVVFDAFRGRMLPQKIKGGPQLAERN
jgi:hypothetical protein